MGTFMSTRSFEETQEEIRDVAGWLSPDQARELYDAAVRVSAGQQIVEIGSFRGRSTVTIASAISDGVRFVAIDPHAGNDRGPQEIEGYASAAATDHEVFLANLDHAGVADRVTHVRAFSHDAHDAVSGELAMLYIDGAHRYAPALADIVEWGRRVEHGGTMLIHDSFSSIGVTLAILRQLLPSKRWRYVGRARSLAVYRADLAPTGRARLGNAARQLAQLPWFVRNLVLKVLLALKLGRPLSAIVGRPVEWPY
jgi:predicted O-methyltransferase YrrM